MSKDYSVEGVPSLKGLAKCCSQSRVIKTLTWREWRKAQEVLLDDTRYATKTVMARRVYAELFAPCTQAALMHTGWHLAPGDFVTIANDLSDGVPVNQRFLAMQNAARAVWKRPNQMPPTLTTTDVDEANIVVRFEDIDGEAGTLGMTLRYREGNLGRGGQQVIVTVDTSEDWNDPFFFTVFAHEIGHALGHGHYRVGNWMYANYTGPRTQLGPQDNAFHLEKYGYLGVHA